MGPGLVLKLMVPAGKGSRMIGVGRGGFLPYISTLRVFGTVYNKHVFVHYSCKKAIYLDYAVPMSNVPLRGQDDLWG